MPSRFHLPFIALALSSLAPGEDSATLMKHGEQALAAGLWEIASDHFESLLNTPGLPAAEKSETATRLAEAWIREGAFAEAYQLLGQSFVVKNQDSQFWRGQALVGLGQISEAISALSPIAADEAAPMHAEAVFTISNLELALGKPESAITSLKSLSRSSNTALSARANFHLAEVYLDLDRNAEARATLPPADALGASYKPRTAFLGSHLALREGKFDEAIAGFQSLLDPNQPYHPAALGLVDAYRKNGDAEQAVSFLLSFIQRYPNSPELGGLFERLLELIPEKPAPHDPILDRIENDWITPVGVSSAHLISDPDGLVDSGYQNQATAASSELLAYSLFTRAVGLMRTGTAPELAESRILCNRLRAEFPEHPLAARSLLEQAGSAIRLNQIEKALNLLSLLRNFTTVHEISGQAAFLEARTAYQQGDRQRAIRLFDEAAQSLAEAEADAARLNSALIKVTTNGGTDTVADTELPADPTIRASIELERSLAEADPVKRRKLLEDFLAAHPEHARAAEARLAAAECALSQPDPDLVFARAQFDALSAAPETSAALGKSRLLALKLHLEDLSGDAENAVLTAQSIIDSQPDDPAAVDATLILGRNNFLTQKYNDARIAFEKVASKETNNPERAQAAWLLAAQSAALVSTPASKQQALILFENAAKLPGPLASVARLEKSRLLIDMNLLPEAIDSLRKRFSSLPENDPQYFPVGFLLGEAISKQGGARPESIADALAVYDKLLAQAGKQPALYNRIQYLRGRSFEQMPDPKDPSKKREREALAAFYSVLETNTPPAEWEDFENCGFSALRLLRNAGRWPAAVACARKIASFNGPRAKEAADIASKIQLEHMIWED